MHSIWNEKYLDNGKLRKPRFLRDWKNGLKHIVFAINVRKLPTFLCVLIICVETVLADMNHWDLFTVGACLEQFIFMAIAYPLILSAWADMKDSKVMAHDTNLCWLTIRMFVLSMIYSILTLLLFVFFIVPGLWFATTFSMALVVLTIDNTKLFESFTLSKSLLIGSFFDVFRYLILWTVGINTLLFVVLYGPFLISLMFLPESSIYQFLYGTSLFCDIFLAFFQLTFLPPTVYMFAYLTEKKLHKK